MAYASRKRSFSKRRSRSGRRPMSRRRPRNSRSGGRRRGRRVTSYTVSRGGIRL